MLRSNTALEPMPKSLRCAAAFGRGSPPAFGATGAGKNQKSLPRVECTIPLLCNTGYELVQVSVVGTLFVRWSSGMDDEERIWSSGKIVMP